MGITDKVKNSLFSRTRPFVQSHFESSHDGKRIAALKDKYKGKRCFICGNGPSLKAEDLNILSQRGEYTFGMNRIFKIFPQTEWRPSFYMYSCYFWYTVGNYGKHTGAGQCDRV